MTIPYVVKHDKNHIERVWLPSKALADQAGCLKSKRMLIFVCTFAMRTPTENDISCSSKFAYSYSDANSLLAIIRWWWW